MGAQKEMIRWAIAIAEIKGKYGQKSYVSDDARELLAYLDGINSQILTALGLAASAAEADRDIDFDTLQPASRVAS